MKLLFQNCYFRGLNDPARVPGLSLRRVRFWGGYWLSLPGLQALAKSCASKVTSVALLVLIFMAANLDARAPVSNEYHVKAAFLYNFAKFVEWPTEAFSHRSQNSGAPLVVGIIGDDPFGSAIDQTINGKSVNGRQLMIRRLKWGQHLRDCHVLFVSSSERNRLPQLLEHLKGASVLTVSEMDQFSQQGGIINFVMEAGKVRFEINTSAAEQARLRISSKLLVLAKTVMGGQRVGRT